MPDGFWCWSPVLDHVMNDLARVCAGWVVVVAAAFYREVCSTLKPDLQKEVLYYEAFFAAVADVGRGEPGGVSLVTRLSKGHRETSLPSRRCASGMKSTNDPASFHG
ncbi:MAG TPA: hypothetical protein QGF35_04270 [Dehalococcoidia bacterium]|nr:hypothetical protein [Dehalococcoidia bacterium]